MDSLIWLADNWLTIAGYLALALEVIAGCLFGLIRIGMGILDDDEHY